MSELPAKATPSSSRGRGKSRGGLGKYLRARGRRGGGRPAAFSERLVLEGEQDAELDEEETAQLQVKYSRRELGTNADRYVEPEADPDAEPEPEVDLSSFLARQRATLEDEPSSPPSSSKAAQAIPMEEDDDVDHGIVQLVASTRLGARGAQSSPANANTRKGNTHVVEFDETMQEMQREKNAAEAMRDLKTRLQGGAKLKTAKPPSPVAHRRDKAPVQDRRAEKAPDTSETFLDDLLG